MKKINIKLLIVLIILILGISIGTTYAIITWNSHNTSITGNTRCFDLDYSTGSAIDMSGMTAVLAFNENSAASTTLSLSKKENCDVTGKATISVTITTSATSATSTVVNLSSGGLKYRIIKNSNSTPIKTGTINSTGKHILYDNFDILDTVDTYTIYFWLDANYIDNTYLSTNFSGVIEASAISGVDN